MMPVNARAVYIKKEASEDRHSMERIRRMLPFCRCERSPEVVDDAELHQLVISLSLNNMPRHGRDGAVVEPVVIFNQFLYGHSRYDRMERKRRFPELFRFGGNQEPYAGYSGWDWRNLGDGGKGGSAGMVCQPGYAIHSFWGCHFRCA